VRFANRTASTDNFDGAINQQFFASVGNGKSQSTFSSQKLVCSPFAGNIRTLAQLEERPVPAGPDKSCQTRVQRASRLLILMKVSVGGK
jgi:hypothetical protein